ncbi:MAG: tetratricopeptide repeat protein [Terrimicrobiaceae bacterium]
MAVKTEKDLPEFHRANWLKAMSAMQLKNYGYAIQLLQTVLKSHPEFLAARQLLRKAAIAKVAGKKSLLSGLSVASFSSIKLQSQLKKDPIAALDAIEKSLESEPLNPQLNLLLKDAALAANFPDIAAFALETILEAAPKDTKVMHDLARHYMKFEDPSKAAEIYQRILAIAPNDLAAVKGAKDAAAAASMKSGGWEKEETTYRDLIKDKDQAVALEQQSRVVRSEEMIDNLLGELHAKAEAEPGIVDTARRIAELYEQKEDWENATQWFNYAASLTNNSDMALVRKASDLQIRQFDFAIDAREQFIASNPGAPESEGYAAELETLKKQRAELALDAARSRVEQNPTDLQLRFELGEILVELENWQEAIPELQKARQNPNVRMRAMSLLGQCFTARGMLDLAAKTLSDAATELLIMDAVKKDVIYNLGLVYEKMGDAVKSVDCMKQIYEVDYGYRDVAKRVESSY